MKKITEMYDEEIVALTEDQLDMLVKVECMEAGVPLEPVPPEGSFFELPKTGLGFQVKGTEFWFEFREDAVKLAALISELAPKLKQKRYEWRTGYDIEWLENYEVQIAIEEKQFFDKIQVQDKEQFLVKRKALKEEYEADKKKYEASREKVRKVSDQIYSAYYAARKEFERTERYKKMFADYVKMADGNSEKARQFFDKAYAADLGEELYQKVFPGYKAHEYVEPSPQ